MASLKIGQGKKFIRLLVKVCDHEKMRVAHRLRYFGVEALAG